MSKVEPPSQETGIKSGGVETNIEFIIFLVIFDLFNYAIAVLPWVWLEPIRRESPFLFHRSRLARAILGFIVVTYLVGSIGFLSFNPRWEVFWYLLAGLIGLYVLLAFIVWRPRRV